MALTIIVITIISLLSCTTAQTTTATPPAISPSPPFVNITDLLSLAGPFHTYLSHLTAAQTIQTFQNQANDTNQGITIFAPSDSAFSSLATPSLSNLTKNQLNSLLLFHAFPKFYTLTDLSKNLTNSNVTTMAGNSFTLNIQDSSGLILVGSGWTNTSISSSVYSAAPVGVYQVDQVLIPEAIFGAPPPLSPSQSPPPPNVPSSPSKGQTPPSDNAPSPQPSETTNNKSASYRIGFSVVTCFVSVSSSIFMMLL